MPIEVGKSAPLFTLPDQNGKAVVLKSFRGKNVILYFYPRDNTPGCTLEAKGFRDRWREIQGEDAVVLGVSPDSQASHTKFCAQFELPFTLLSDPDKKVMIKYGAFGKKVMYGKKTMGVIRSTVWIGPTGKVIRHWPKVAKATDHPAEVLEALRAAGRSARDRARPGTRGE
jgi:peroxiredoxin Q/BCP